MTETTDRTDTTGTTMDPDVRSLVHKASIVSATIGVVLSPIPLLDEIVLIPVFAQLTRRIAKLHGLARAPWRPIVKSAAVGLVARGIVNIPFAPVPGVSTAVDAATAAALTEILGAYVDAVCRDPESAKTLKVREVAALIQRAVRSSKAVAAAQAIAGRRAKNANATVV